MRKVHHRAPPLLILSLIIVHASALQKFLRLRVQPLDTAEDALMGLHRNTWHMMIRADSCKPHLLECEGQQLKTAWSLFDSDQNPIGTKCP